MDTQAILNITLVFHLLGLGLVVGTTTANYIGQIEFWHLYDKNREQGLAAFKAFSKLQIIGMVGLSLSILTGLTMLYIFQWTFVELVWFKIKLSIVLLLFVNGFTLGRTSTLKLRALFAEENQPNELPTDTSKLRKNLQIFNLTQLSLFVVIIILSVFRFN